MSAVLICKWTLSHYDVDDDDVSVCLSVGFTSMCVNHIPSPVDNARRKIEHIYTGPLDTELVESMFECSPEVRLSVCLSVCLNFLASLANLSCKIKTSGYFLQVSKEHTVSKNALPKN